MKKRIFFIFFTVILFLFSLGVPASASGEAANTLGDFTTADALVVLRAAVGSESLTSRQRARLNVYGNTITTADALRILQIATGILPQPDYIFIRDRQYCTSLKFFSLAGQQITNEDVISLQRMSNLEVLRILRVPDIDLTPLGGLINLEILHLRDSQVTDISFISELTKLIEIEMWDNSQITNLPSFNKLTNLETLWLGNTQVADITPLSGLTNLESLRLSNTQVTDITPLSGLTKLEHLGLWGNQISDITPLSSLINLQDLVLERNKISDISPLSELTNLSRLFLAYNEVSDITPLNRLTNLETLMLGERQVIDLTPLHKLENLWGLGLDIYISEEQKRLLQEALPDVRIGGFFA